MLPFPSAPLGNVAKPSPATTTTTTPQIKRTKNDTLPSPVVAATAAATTTTTTHPTAPAATAPLHKPPSGTSSGSTVIPNPNIPGAGSVYGNAAGYLPPPPQPSPTPDGATMKGIKERLDALWVEQKKEVSTLKPDSKKEFKTMNDLPLARIKRVMKSDEDVRMISAEAPILFAKACEMFVLDLTSRSWAYSEHNKRGGLEREDVLQVLKETDIFDFLAEVMIVPSDPAKARKPTM